MSSVQMTSPLGTSPGRPPGAPPRLTAVWRPSPEAPAVARHVPTGKLPFGVAASTYWDGMTQQPTWPFNGACSVLVHLPRESVGLIGILGYEGVIAFRRSIAC